eukprot:9142032-Pyramimonas_sp.AAC.1
MGAVGARRSTPNLRTNPEPSKTSGVIFQSPAMTEWVGSVTARPRFESKLKLKSPRPSADLR